MPTLRQPACVLLVDDHPAFLRQTQGMIAGEFQVVAALPDGTELEAAVAKLQPEIIVLDITLPGNSGIELARRLKAARGTAKIVFLTVHADPDYVRAAFDVGALGYVVKARLASDLLTALRAALEGHRFVSPVRVLEECR